MKKWTTRGEREREREREGKKIFCLRLRVIADCGVCFVFSFKVCYRFDADSCEEFSLGEKRGESGTETRLEQNRTEESDEKREVRRR